MPDAPPGRRRARIAIAAAVLAGHGVVLIGLVAAFAPDFARQVVARGLAAVEITSPPPPPPPPPQPEHRATIIARRAPAPAAAAALPIVAPSPLIPLAMPTFAAPVVGAGTGLSAGAGGNGLGHGGGGAGSGQGGATGTGPPGDPVKIGGGIDLARDYDPATRALRLGDFVVIDLAVGTDGVPTGCTVTRPSRDVAANALTCQLAMARFRFRPAHDGAGRPVAGVYGWKQVWKK